MAGTESSATVVANTSKAATQSDAETPTSAAIGPQMANPSGWKAIEPNQSYALTRDSHASGTWRISVDSQTELPSIIAIPPSSAPKASTASGAPAARHSSGATNSP
jgi:hypothetical protein